VFVQTSGDSIFSESTLSVGGSVQDACAAVLKHWADHAAELKAMANANSQSARAVVANGAAPPVATVVQQSSISVDASVPNCDIEVDGNFMGSTPSTLNLTPGKHQIVVKKTGYQDWSRTMMVAGGAVRLSADMIAR
jgi:diacylglycerol kinase family enzyme